MHQQSSPPFCCSCKYGIHVSLTLEQLSIHKNHAELNERMGNVHFKLVSHLIHVLMHLMELYTAENYFLNYILVLFSWKNI